MGITMSELQNLVNIIEEARPISAPRIMGEKHALFLLQEEVLPFLHQGEMSDNQYSICIGNSMICSDIWHKYHE